MLKRRGTECEGGPRARCRTTSTTAATPRVRDETRVGHDPGWGGRREGRHRGTRGRLLFHFEFGFGFEPQ